LEKRKVNKDLVVSQIEENKKKQRDQRWQNLQEEKKMIQELVVDVNTQVRQVKEEVIQQLDASQALKNPKVIKRIGK